MFFSRAGHAGMEALEGFWESNIAPNKFHFDVKQSFETAADAEGNTEVANIGTITTALGQMNFKKCTTTTGVFTYKADKNGKLLALRAFYSFEDMMATFKSVGKKSKL